MVLGTHVVLCMTARFFENNVLPAKKSRSSLGFFECIGKFSFFSQFFNFFSIWSIMTVYITVIAVRHHRTLNLAVSHKEINGINRFLMCPSNIFLRNGSGFSDFWHNGRQFKY